MKPYRLILPILFILSLVSARAADDSHTRGDDAARIAGVWQWLPKDQKVTIKADGTCTSTYNVTGTWTQLDAEKRTYKIEWSSGFVDTLTLSEDGDTLTGTNQHAEHPEPFTRIK